ncbi:hypothetical protein AV530_004335 [Patagioenas fasciata monilis]|uniref:Uncharacterized protein n=1 Tax=Patagioenas fasciata monilis TaxID=372326 RepID=A0A1V4K930_PATFA|nr:hypothetical protein AV530_004335 [Patagioenas fasciata monilis]
MHGEEKMRPERQKGSPEVLFIMTCTGSSMVASVNGVIDFTRIVDSRASPRQEGSDSLTCDGYLNIITLKQGEQEETESSTRTGTTQLPTLLPGPQDQVTYEKDLFIEAALGAVRASNPEHLTYLFESSSSLQDLSHSQVVQLLAFSFAMGT